MRASISISALTLLMGALLLSVPFDAYSQPMTFSASDDAYVQQRRPKTNKGVTSLKVFNDGKQINTYLKFNVSGLAGPVTSAKVRMKLRSNTPDAGMLHSVSNNLKGTATPWTERTITWVNAPALGTLLDSAPGLHVINEFIEFDVTSAVTGGGSYSFAIQTSTFSSFKYNSRQNGTAPELIVTTGAGGVNQAPLANAGIDQVLTDTDNSGFELAALNGSGSSDPDGTIASYIWSEGGAQIASGLSPTASLSVGAHTILLTVTDNQGATATDAVLITVNAGGPAPNQPPVANAGIDQTATDADNTGFELIALNGSASSDADGVINSYVWSEAGLQIAVGANASISLAVGAHTIMLTVTDDQGASSTDIMLATINAAPPVGGATSTFTALHDAYVNQRRPNTNKGITSLKVEKTTKRTNSYLKFSVAGLADPVTSATLQLFVRRSGTDGGIVYSTSNDLAGTITPWTERSITWNNAPAPGAALGAAGGPVAIGDIIEIDVTSFVTGNGDFSFAIQSDINTAIKYNSKETGKPAKLLVKTGGTTPPPANQAPIANAGLDQTLTDTDNSGSEAATLDGSGSSDADGTIASYAWTEGALPLATGVAPALNLPVGAHTITLTVTDNQGATASDQVVITINAGSGPVNVAPIANAGADAVVTDADNSGTELVTLDASASTDADGTISSYVWSEGGAQIATGVSPSVNLALGTHTINLLVTDNIGATSTDQVLILINQAPLANAGPDQGMIDRNNNGTEPVTLDGSGSSDADGTIASYSWSDGGVEIATGVNPALTLGVGIHALALTITDNDGGIATDSMIVHVGAFGSFLLTLTDPNAGGLISPAGNSVHAPGSIATITAAAAAAHDFGFWSGDIAARNAFGTSADITMNADKTIQVNFLARPAAPGETTNSSLGFSGALSAFGPTHVYGYPSYYTDATGLSVVQGLNPVDPLRPEFAIGDPAVLPDINAPLSIAATNFYEEMFYWMGEAFMSTGAGMAQMVAAVECVWGPTEAIIEGDQTVFVRLRLRVDLLNGGTYTITHPWGQETFQVQSGGVRAINLTVDAFPAIGDPNNFAGPLDGGRAKLGTYLQWAPLGSAPAGYVGDIGIPHIVTGSPTGFNKFRIEGPNVGGPFVDMIETDLFNIAGKIIDPIAAAPVKVSTGSEGGKGDTEVENVLPKHFALQQNVPNPFNPNTTIRFSLPTGSDVNLSVFNVEGRKVRTLLRGEMEAGNHQIVWQGTNNDGVQVSSGVYFYRLETADHVEVRKMMMMK